MSAKEVRIIGGEDGHTRIHIDGVCTHWSHQPSVPKNTPFIFSEVGGRRKIECQNVFDLARHLCVPIADEPVAGLRELPELEQYLVVKYHSGEDRAHNLLFTNSLQDAQAEQKKDKDQNFIYEKFDLNNHPELVRSSLEKNDSPQQYARDHQWTEEKAFRRNWLIERKHNAELMAYEVKELEGLQVEFGKYQDSIAPFPKRKIREPEFRKRIFELGWTHAKDHQAATLTIRRERQRLSPDEEQELIALEKELQELSTKVRDEN